MCTVPAMTVDHDLPVPAWRQVAAILRQRIADGELTKWLPGERYMAAELGVAVGTVRKAIAVLRDEGLIDTVHGRGSYVHESGPGGV